MGDKTGLLAGLATRVVLVLGVAYVSLWWSYQHFYSTFAVSPDDVGLSPTGGGLGDVFNALLRLGLWLSIALLALGLLPVACVAFALYAIEHPSHKAASIGAALLALGLLVVTFFANRPFVDNVYAGVVVALIVVVTLVCWLLARSSPIDPKTAPAEFAQLWWEKRQRWLLSICDLFLVIAVIGVLFIDLPGDAHNVAETLLADAGTPSQCKVPGIGAPFGRFRLDLLSVHGTPARFAAAKLPSGLPTGTPFDGIYLGTANGWIVIYEKGSDGAPDRVLRLPASSGASIIVDAGLPNCPGVH